MADPTAAAFPQHDPQLAPPPPAQQQQQQLAHDLDGSQAEDSSGGKRKRQSEGGPGTRSKRSRYISIACNECKRRKIKCNGEQPCQRCGNLDLDCVYAPNCCTSNFRDSTEFKQMSQHMYALQDQLEGLWHTVNHIRTLFPNADIPMPAPPPPRPLDIFTAIDGLNNGSPTEAHPAHAHTQGPQPAPSTQQPGTAAAQSTAANIDPSLGMSTLRKAVETYRMALGSPATQGPYSASASNTTNAGQRYAPGPSSRDPSASQLSYELARASMESMGIGAGARTGDHNSGSGAGSDVDNAAAAAAAAAVQHEDAAVAAAAAAAAASAGNGVAGGSADGRDERGAEPDHQRALAELLHNAELQQQISQQGGAAQAQHGAGNATRAGADVKNGGE